MDIKEEVVCLIDKEVKLSKNEIDTINEVLKSLEGLGAKALSEIAYKTKPMKAVGAEQDNDKGLNEILNLSE